MSEKKNVPINYYSRDFQTIKSALVEHAKRYYPDSFKDFNEAGFGSLMLDTVSYVGDVLSFYLDYQVNESFLSTATELKNILKIAKQLGYKHQNTPSAYGLASFFITVPSTVNGLSPDMRYIPTLKAGSEFGADTGASFILLQDVRFDLDINEVVVAANDEDTNIPTYWAIKAYGVVLSGKYQTSQIEVGEFQRFLKLRIPQRNVAEIISVIDQEGNEYYEVENLAQDIVYVPISNKGVTKNETSSIMRPYSVPRRYVIERDDVYSYLQFGYGVDDSNSNRSKPVDPSEVVLQKHGKKYITDTSFDPARLLNSDKLGVVPSNTILSVTARVVDTTDISVGIDSLNTVNKSLFEFVEEATLDQGLVRFIKSSLEVTNEEKITGQVPGTSVEEVRVRALNSISSQNRAVTLQDYKALIYNMPNSYGNIKRVSVLRDKNSFKRNLNVHVISEDSTGVLTNTNIVTKENLKIWLNTNRMINDTIDILDAKIINLAINYVIIVDARYNRYEIINNCSERLRSFYSTVREIGEPIFISDIIKTLKDVIGVSDVASVKITNKRGGAYSDYNFDIKKHTSNDGRFVMIPEDAVFEIKYPELDIRGAAK